MLTQVAELLIRVADLVEAEGRDLRRVVNRMLAGLSFSVLAAGLFLGGACLVLAGVWYMLKRQLDPGWASIVTGLLALAVGFGAFKLAENYHQ